MDVANVAYDIYFLMKHYNDGVSELAKEFRTVKDKTIVLRMVEKLKGKFASVEHAGPKDVSDFLDLEDEEDIEIIRRDAYEQVQALLELLMS